MTTQDKKPLTAIFLTVLLDMLGIGIVIPILPALFSDTDASILPLGTSVQQKAMLFAALSAVYPLGQFFGAPILGALSDKHGRKPLLQLSLVGATIGYILFAIAISQKSIPMLFLARIIPGFMAGNIAIIFSSIGDIAQHDPTNRPRYFGLVGAAFGIGFMLGPALGSMLANSNLVSWFNHSTPFYFTALLSVINIVLIQFNFPETLTERRDTKLSLLTGVRNVRTAFSFPNLRKLFTVSLFYSLGFSSFAIFFGYYMMHKFGISEREIGIVFAWTGLCLIFTQLVVVRRFSGKVAPQNILKYTLLALSFIITMVLIPQGAWYYVLAVNPLIALAQGMSSPNMTALVSSSALPDQQGQILGINQSMVSLGQFLPALLGGVLSAWWLPAPILAAGVFIFIGWAIFVFR